MDNVIQTIISTIVSGYESFKTFFSTKGILKSVLFVFSVFSAIEIVFFGIAVLVTFSNVIRYPDYTTSRIRACFVVVMFILFRVIPIPFLYVGLGFTSDVVEPYLPTITRAAIVIMGIWMNLTITVPCFTTFYSRYKYGIGNKALPESTTRYRFMVILPVYNETFDLLVAGIQSIVDQRYERNLFTLHISFDSDEKSELYMNLLDHLNTNSRTRTGNGFVGTGTTTVGIYQGVQVYVHRFPHGGKRLTQAKTFQVIKKEARLDPDNCIVVFLDSDNYTYNLAFANLASMFERYPSKLALAGFMTCMSRPKEQETVSYESNSTSPSNDEQTRENREFETFRDLDDPFDVERNVEDTTSTRPENQGSSKRAQGGTSSWKFWNMIQDVEYCSGETVRSFELLMGTVNCLPGGFTAVRYPVFEYDIVQGNQNTEGAIPKTTVADKYFGDLPHETVTDYHRNYLGEDRYLTHLLHQSLPRFALGFAPSVRTKTDPPSTFGNFVKQRRRWFLGALSNEAYMVTDTVITSKYSLLIAFKTLHLAFKANFFAQIVMGILALSSLNVSAYWSMMAQTLAVGVPLGFNWISAIITAYMLGHYKAILLHPVMIIVCSVTQVAIDGYALWTFRQRSWGGPRTTTSEN